MKRLIKNKKMKKIASFSDRIESFYLPSGDVIGFDYRIVNNKPRYQVYQEGLYNISSFIDTDDYDDAARMYKDLLAAFNGIKDCENFSIYEKELKSEIQEKLENSFYNNTNVKALQMDSRFLGMPRSEEF